MTIINKASDKFKDRQDEVCGFVFGFMREMNTLEDEIFERSEELKRHKLVMGIPTHQVGPGAAVGKFYFVHTVCSMVKVGNNNSLLSGLHNKIHLAFTVEKNLTALFRTICR
mgnify:CR=1 FL=1